MRERPARSGTVRKRKRDRNREFGSKQPAAVTAPAPVIAPPAPTPINAIVRIRGRLTARGARVTLLRVAAPDGARVFATCFGPCPVRRQRAQARSAVMLRRFHRPFRAGAVLVIRVTMPGRIGKYTRFRIRRGRAPARVDRCIPPGLMRRVPCT